MSRLVERMTAEELADITYQCAVCRGISPEADGHDQSPPCVITAMQEIIVRAIAWDKLHEVMGIPFTVIDRLQK